jgi:hypothetical protein
MVEVLIGAHERLEDGPFVGLDLEDEGLVFDNSADRRLRRMETQVCVCAEGAWGAGGGVHTHGPGRWVGGTGTRPHHVLNGHWRAPQVRVLLEGVVSVRARAKLLAMFTSERLGGSRPAGVRWGKGAPPRQARGLVGSLTEGTSRQRSLLFKHLCDLEGVDVPCRLMRTLASHTPHTTSTTTTTQGAAELRVWVAVAVGPALDGKGSEWVIVPL